MDQHSDSYQLVWSTVKKIPKGKVATYGELASVCGLIGQARLVGYALRNTPVTMKIPWHRVINAQGKISLPNSNGQYIRQKNLLEKEGVVFKKEKIDLSKYGWLRSFRTK